MAGIPLSEWSGSGATRELHETIKCQIEASNKQSKVISRLTIFMVILAVIQTVATIVQVVQIFKTPQNAYTTNNLPNTAEKLNEQQNKSGGVTHVKPLK